VAYPKGILVLQWLLLEPEDQAQEGWQHQLGLGFTVCGS